MNSKLTLSINSEIIESAKNYAKANDKSLSNVVEEYLKSLTVNDKNNSNKKHYGKIVNELKGSVKLPQNLTSYKAILQDALQVILLPLLKFQWLTKYN